MSAYENKILQDEWKIEKLLGKGVYSRVFKARSKIDGRVKALKIGFLLVGGNALNLAFINELCVTRFLDHPKIVKIDDANVYHDLDGILEEDSHRAAKGKSRLVYAFEMDIYDGDIHSLDLTNLQCKEVTFQLLDILRYLHSHDILHADIKSGNVLYRRRSRTESDTPSKDDYIDVYLTDFGISKTCVSSRVFHEPGKFLYPIVCRPPELIKWHCISPPFTDCRFDIWALGCMLYEMMCQFRYRLFNGDTPQKMAQQHENYKKHGINNIFLMSSQIKFLESVLVVDINKRLSAEELLKSEYFDGVRYTLHPTNKINLEYKILKDYINRMCLPVDLLDRIELFLLKSDFNSQTQKLIINILERVYSKFEERINEEMELFVIAIGIMCSAMYEQEFLNINNEARTLTMELDRPVADTDILDLIVEILKEISCTINLMYLCTIRGWFVFVNDGGVCSTYAHKTKEECFDTALLHRVYPVQNCVWAPRDLHSRACAYHTLIERCVLEGSVLKGTGHTIEVISL